MDSIEEKRNKFELRVGFFPGSIEGPCIDCRLDFKGRGDLNKGLCRKKPQWNKVNGKIRKKSPVVGAKRNLQNI